MELQVLQDKVDSWIKNYGVRYFDILTNMAQLTEEVGEVARIISRRYGEQSEKKKNEILQMSMLAPKLSILDETDSGLDIDALKIVADGVNSLRNKNNSFLIITHYQRLLDYVKPDFVHILMNGKIIKSGGPELALELEKKGYKNFN